MAKRNLFLLILALLTSLILAACSPEAASNGDDDGGDTTGGETTGGDTDGGDDGDTANMDSECIFPVEQDATVVFSGWGDPTEQGIYEDSIERFNAVCPNVTVDYQPIPDDFQTKMKAAMAGGTAPDVMYIDHQLMTAFASTNQLLALDEYMAEADTSREDFIPALLTIFTYEGQTYALPKDWGTLGLIYLPAAFEEAGLEAPTADWTWPELQAAAEAIAENTDYAGFCMGADQARFAAFVLGNGGAFTNEDYTQATVDTPEVLEAAEFVAGLHESGALSTPADLGAGWCGEAIGKELAGMTYEGGWMVNYMRNDFPDVEWKAVELPAGPAGKADYIFTNGIGVNAGTDYPRAAAAFAIFLTSGENQGEIVKTGFAYSTHPDQVDLIVDENDKAIAAGGTFEGSHAEYWGPNTGAVNAAVSQALERIFLGEQSVEEAFAQAQEEIQSALDGE